MQVTKSLYHPDEVSGTWEMSDGTKVFWTEGRSSHMVAISPDGTSYDIPPYAMEDCRDENPELIDALIDATENGIDATEDRMMTDAETQEWEDGRHYKHVWLQ